MSAADTDTPGSAMLSTGVPVIKVTAMSSTEFNNWYLIFNNFCDDYRSNMSKDAREKLCSAIWIGSGADILHCETILAMCCVESSMKVRKYFPSVHNKYDYMGAHACVYVKCLYYMGVIRDSNNYKMSKQWAAIMPTLPDQPEYGTLIAIIWFEHIVQKCHGNLDTAIRAWNQGCNAVNTPKATIYLSNVEEFRQRIIDTTDFI